MNFPNLFHNYYLFYHQHPYNLNILHIKSLFDKIDNELNFVQAGANVDENKFKQIIKKYCKNEIFIGLHNKEEIMNILKNLIADKIYD